MTLSLSETKVQDCHLAAPTTPARPRSSAKEPSGVVLLQLATKTVSPPCADLALLEVFHCSCRTSSAAKPRLDALPRLVQPIDAAA